MSAPASPLLTAADAEQAQARVAGGLAHLQRGERVALVVPPSTALVTAVAGALRAGVVPVVLDPATPRRELSAVLADAAPALTVDSAGALAALHAHPPAALAPVPLGRPMHFTSGTTGRRKGVWSGVLDVDAARALWAEETELWEMGPADVHAVVSPLYHSAPLRFAVATLLAGGAVLVAGKFTVDGFLTSAGAHRVTTMFTAPAQLARLREAADPRTAGVLGRLRLLAHAGAPCPEPVKRWVLEQTADGVAWEFYGSTEGQLTACPPAQWLARPGTVGRARPGRTLLTDPDGTIWCVVPAHARFQYFGAPEKTAAAWRETPAGPAFTVGDLGRLDADGYLFLDGRRDDLVLSGGVNVYPLEVERIVEESPLVAELAVFGVPDDRWGQRVEAAVVLSSAAGDDPAAALAALEAHAREHLTAAQRPRHWRVVDALPRTSTGKVRRTDLRGAAGEPREGSRGAGQPGGAGHHDSSSPPVSGGLSQ